MLILVGKALVDHILKEGKMNFLDVFVLHFNAIDGGNLKITGSAVPTICAPFDDTRPYVDELRKRFNVR